jgi:hypothetical protein
VNLKGYDQPTQTFACTFEELTQIVTMLASEELRSS